MYELTYYLKGPYLKQSTGGVALVYEITVEKGVLRMDARGGIFGSSIEDFDVIMARVIDRLVTDRKVTSIVLFETREHEYDAEQTKMLVEIASAIYEIVKERRIISLKNRFRSRSFILSF